MALTDEEKLQNLAAEAINDATKISSEIEAKTKQEFQEKLETDEKKLLANIYSYIQSEIDKIRKEKSLELSQVSIKTRQEYFKEVDSVSARIFENVNEQLKTFINSENYETYLLQSCKNVIKKYDIQNDVWAIDILYMPRDEEIIKRVKIQIDSEFTDFERNVEFKQDSSIKIGGLRFFNKSKNILINDIFDEKIERAKELLSSLIGPRFTAI